MSCRFEKYPVTVVHPFSWSKTVLCKLISKNSFAKTKNVQKIFAKAELILKKKVAS